MTAQEKWLKSNDMLELAEMLKALAHTSRVSIMFLLCSRKEKRLTVKYIYEELEMPQPVVSRHLAILRKSGLLQRSSEGINTYYEIRTGNKFVRKIAECFSAMK